MQSQALSLSLPMCDANKHPQSGREVMRIALAPEGLFPGRPGRVREAASCREQEIVVGLV